MVMHARKQPRVNDGYTERKDAHLHQWLDRHQGMQQQQRSYGGLYGDGSPAEGSHGHGARDDSPGGHQSPRYQHQGPYLERNKEKRGSLGLAEKKVSQYLATGSIGQNAPGTHREYRDRDREQRPDGNHHGEGNHSQDRPQSSASGSKRPAEHKDGKDHRAEQVQKSAVRVCGDWSEHISSSGKRYYYNCKTEVSQWEKPKEWHDGAKAPERPRDGRGNAKPSSSATATRVDERTRHSSSSDQQQQQQQRYDGRGRGGNYAETASSATPDKQAHRGLERGKSETNAASSTPGSSIPRGNSLHRTNSAADSPSSSHSHNHKGHGGQVGHSSHLGHSSHPDLKRNSVYSYGSGGEPAKRRSRHESDSSRPVGHPSSHRPDDGGQGEEMDVSPGSTPTSSRQPPSSCAAIQTLQELQKALTLHIKKQQRGPQNASSSSGTTSAQLQSQLAHLQHNILQQQQQTHHQQPLQQQQAPPVSQSASLSLPHDSPHHGSATPISHQHEDNNIRELHGGDGRDGAGGSPISDMTSPRSSCRSPTPSTGSSQNAAALGSSALSAMALKSQQSVTLTPSLSNYYNEKLIGHVLGWQGEHLERQADRFRQEALAVGSLHLSRVAVELKRARSNVRIAEIQSTIHEQRVMVLQQQRAEIENLKPPTSLLPS